tara:strand:- start:143737 stop:145659 length:1923 start_codon:yes stop_codon:yes gene_type:complete
MKKAILIDYLDLINLLNFLFFRRNCILTFVNASSLVCQIVRTFNLEKNFAQLEDISQSTNRLEGLSLYEWIQWETTRTLSSFVNSKKNQKIIKRYEKTYKITPVKLETHLQETFFYKAYRQNEVLSYFLTSDRFNELYLPNSEISKHLETRGVKIHYYSSLFFSFFSKPITRKNYYYDNCLKDYFPNIYKLFLRRIKKEISGFLCSVFMYFLRNPIKKTNICIEINKRSVDREDGNDLYWLPKDEKSVTFINRGTDDEKSIRSLESSGKQILKETQNILSILKKPTSIEKWLVADVSVSVKSFYTLCKMLIKSVLTVNHVEFYSYEFVLRSLYYKNLYKKIDFRLLWTMSDIDPDKLTKAQAIEWNSAVLAGGHWSILDQYRVDNQKAYDLVFTWGDHFFKNNFSFYKGQRVKVTGYPSDHYFESKKKLVDNNKKQKQIVISYHDNEVYNDFPNDPSSQRGMIQLFCELLRERNNVSLICKPKNKSRFNYFISQEEKMKNFIDEGRIEIFYGVPPASKYPPAEVGYMSDIVVGLGLSTAAAECHFSGTLGLHYDPSNFMNNSFSSKGKGKVVFNKIDDLKSTLLRLVDNVDLIRERYDEASECYSLINKFSDYNCSSRTYKIIKEIISDNNSPREVIKNY